jgi:Zn-dependent M28 family amino/carboxypeptidase
MEIVIGAAVVALAVAGATRYVVAMPGRSFRGHPPSLTSEEHATRQRLERHVEVLGRTIGERNVWSERALEAAAAYVGRTFKEVGYRVTSQPYEVCGTTVSNIEVEVRGNGERDQVVVVGAHYDTVLGAPGANDNGSGVAAVLELARRFTNRQPRRTIRFVAFVNEEPPFCFTADMGSKVYASRCRARGDRIVAMLSLETIGYFSDERGSQRYPFPFGLFYPRTGNFIGFVGNLSSRPLVRRSIAAFRRAATIPSEGTAAPGYLPGIYWSDHWSFWRERYPAIMVTDTAPFRYPFYHTNEDTPDRVDYDRLTRVVTGLDTVVTDLGSR